MIYALLKHDTYHFQNTPCFNSILAGVAVYKWKLQKQDKAPQPSI